MKVSLNWVKKYVDLPKEITNKQIAYDLTLRTVEVESVENTSDNILVFWRKLEDEKWLIVSNLSGEEQNLNLDISFKKHRKV